MPGLMHLYKPYRSVYQSGLYPGMILRLIFTGMLHV